MLRDNKTIISKPVAADYTASAKVACGMGVVLNTTNKTFAPPSAAGDTNIFLVFKERIPTGMYTALSDFSDYDDIFMTVNVGEYAKLKKYLPGEEFMTDQYAEGVTAGKYVNVGTDGKFAALASGTSRYLCIGIVNDNDHKLALIQVCEAVATESPTE